MFSSVNMHAICTARKGKREQGELPIGSNGRLRAREFPGAGSINERSSRAPAARHTSDHYAATTSHLHLRLHSRPLPTRPFALESH